MSIEDDFEAALARTRDDAVHDLDPLQTLQVRILGEVYPGGDTGSIEELVAVRQANRVKPRLDDLVEHLLPVTRPESMRAERPSLHAEPAHTGQSDLFARLVTDVRCYAAQRAIARC